QRGTIVDPADREHTGPRLRRRGALTSVDRRNEHPYVMIHRDHAKTRCGQNSISLAEDLRDAAALDTKTLLPLEPGRAQGLEPGALDAGQIDGQLEERAAILRHRAVLRPRPRQMIGEALAKLEQAIAPRRPRPEIFCREAVEQRITDQRAHGRVVRRETGSQPGEVAAGVDREPLARLNAVPRPDGRRLPVALAGPREPRGEAARRGHAEPEPALEI